MPQQESKVRIPPPLKPLEGLRAKSLLIKGSLAFAVFLLICAAGLSCVFLLFWDSPGPVNWDGLLTVAVIFLGPVFVILGTPLLVSAALYVYQKHRKPQKQDFSGSISFGKAFIAVVGGWIFVSWVLRECWLHHIIG